MTMALSSTQAPAQNLAYDALAGTDAAGKSDGGSHRTSAPTCYYPLAPARGNDDGKDTPAQPFMGSAMKGTLGYERFIDALMMPRPEAGHRPGMDRRAAQAAVDNLSIKPGTILLAPCHPGDSEAYRRSSAAPAGPRAPAGEPGAARRAREAGLDTQPVETTPCRVASRWRHVLDGVAALFGPMVWLLPMAARPEHVSAMLPAARDGCLDAGTPPPGQADDLQGYERYLAAVSYGSAY
jgi:hypothetical protein